ncbi:photosynthetic NDH subunit of subcomplex B 3 [Citrus sinensis]|uniref:photosynthetic NDH subunit of subcomplex B 3, chloroplastic isoform X3 n=1 Tax=Citrus sinensis TaxID=2711 RepID=UPI00219F5471|nr:photosynthetic NDH subunit of subcomplex B 3, chloroplastic isoform X3 [Citrus sinensis]KAH9665808.1 photosynthetic NDH subunit of subcomplex B 3 [Citrus sinensis]
MGSLQLNSYRLASHSLPYNFNCTTNSHKSLKFYNRVSFSRSRIRATATIPKSDSQANAAEEPPVVNFAFVHARPLSNCAGGGTCGTCMVEVIEGNELLGSRTDKEKEKLKRKPKNWRLACQTTVGTPDSTGLVVIQQLPEWKGHEWKYEKIPTSELPQ